MIHSMVVIKMTPLKSTIVNVPLIHISKQIITRNRNIIIIRIPVHTCFAFTWDSRCWIFNMASSRFSLPRRSKCSFFRRSTLFLVAIVHTFAWLEVSVSVILLTFFTFKTLSSHSHFVFTDKLDLNSWSLVPYFGTFWNPLCMQLGNIFGSLTDSFLYRSIFFSRAFIRCTFLSVHFTALPYRTS